MLEHYRVFFCFLLLIIFLLNACNINISSRSTKNPIYSKWLIHQQSIAQLISYQISGTFAYLSDQQKISARFNWQQINSDCYRIQLINHIGRIEIDLNVKPNNTQLIDNQGKYYIGNNPEIMIYELVGIIIPFNKLRHWILGLLDDNVTDFTIDSYGYLHRSNYNYNKQYWTITYFSYYYNMFPPLPARLEIYNGNNSIKLKIDNWSL